jgi:hypothetical protein
MEHTYSRYGYIEEMILLIKKERSTSLLSKKEQIDYVLLEMCIYLYGHNETDYINNNMVHIKNLCYFFYDVLDDKIDMKTLEYNYYKNEKIVKEDNTNDKKKTDCLVCKVEKINCIECKEYMKNLEKEKKGNDKKCNIT